MDLKNLNGQIKYGLSFFLLFVVGLFAKEGNLTEQKFLIEHNIQDRVESALDKLLDVNFIVSVSVDVEFTPLLIQKSIVKPGAEKSTLGETEPAKGGSHKSMSQSEGGYNFPWQSGNLPAVLFPNRDEVVNEAEPAKLENSATNEPDILTQTYQQYIERLPIIKQISIRVILNAATTHANTEETVRWAIKEVVPSFDETRGDNIEIKTTTFREAKSNPMDDILAYEVDKQMQNMRIMIEDLQTELSLRDSLIYEIARSPVEAMETERKKQAIKETFKEKENQFLQLKNRLDEIEQKYNEAEQKNTDLQVENTALYEKLKQPTQLEDFGTNSKLMIAILVFLVMLVLFVVFFILRNKRDTVPVNPQQNTQEQVQPAKQKKSTQAVRAETESLRQHLVALSVGNPETAKRIMGEWLTDADAEDGETAEDSKEEKGEK